MRGLIGLVLLAALLIGGGAFAQNGAQNNALSGAGDRMPVYRLNPGDVVRISVWREEELLREARIQPDGTVSYPLVGAVEAAGRTTGEVADAISGQLEEFIPDAVVTVELLDAQGYRVYVIGEVSEPGEYQLARPITVMQALSLAGGLTPFASEAGIRILRDAGGGQMNIAFDYDAVADDGEMDKNIFLQAGDTVIVPTGFF